MKRPGGAERRCGGAAPLFDAPHAPPSIMYGALLPALRSVIKLLLLLKAQIHRDAPLRLVSLFFFLSFVSLLLFVPSVPHPLSFSLFSLSPHSFIYPLLLSHLFLIPIFSLLNFHLFPSSPHLLLFHYIFSLSFLTSFPFLCFVSCPPFPYLLPHLLFPSLYLLSLLLISSLVSFLPHLYPPSLISCFLIPLSFSVTMSSFFSFPPPHLHFPLSLLLLMHSPPFLPMLFLLSHPFFQLYFTVLISSSPTFSLNSPSVILSLQLLSLSSSLPSSLLSPFPFYLPLFPLPPSPSCHGCMSASLICGLSAGPCYPPDGALFLG